jgi:adenylate cyclase
MAFLVVGDSGRRVFVGEFEIIGRSQTVSIPLADSGVSRQHASIQSINGQHWLTDLGSSNGSFVNDVAVTNPTALRHGDKLRIGTVELRYENEAEARTSKAEFEVQETRFVPAPTSRLTLLVGDLQQFSSISERESAERVAAILREFYAGCEQTLVARGAVIDKFMGDGVFAYWHGDRADVRARAAECARALTHADLSQTWRRLRASAGGELHCNVGLHVGEVALGVLSRGVSTAVGEAVNTVFRVQGLTRSLGVPIVATDAFLEDWPAGQGHFRYAGQHPIKGYAQPVGIWIPR